jgi:1-acyl-sn-glycerol-3-phosphate acyltransferase
MNRIRAIFTIIQMAITISITIVLMYIFRSKTDKVRQIWASMQMKLLGVKFEIHGEQDSSVDMIMINHQSVMDIITYEYLSKRNLAWVAKKELSDIPWFGHIIKAPRNIAIERESKKSLVKLLKDTKDRLDHGRQLAIFPEGTRSDGTKMRKFKGGAKIIAEKYDLKVQPIVMIGTNDVLDSKKITQTPGTIKVFYLPSFEVDKESSWYEDMETNMKEIFYKEVSS